MWPAFVVMAIADGWIGHALPINPPSQSVIAGVVVALVLNLICIVVLSPLLGALLRRVRPDLPVAIARNYAGVLCVLLVTAGFVGIGLAKRTTIAHDSAAMHDAVVRAAGYIGDHAPAPFEARADHLDVIAIEVGSIYRVCVDNAAADPRLLRGRTGEVAPSSQRHAGGVGTEREHGKGRRLR